jgi:serine/threonine protein kinase
LAVGRQFGPFTLRRKLARGGMADIFLATRRVDQDEELCVIKMMLPSSLRNPQALKLFLGEARLAAKLDHPNVVRILSLDRADDYYFIAMEYVPGETLFHMIHRALQVKRPVRPLEAAAAIHQACAGLTHAHESTDPSGKPLNLVHRDISPSNIIMSYDGVVKILDFGIAAAATRTAGFPEGKALGKFSYMSPEQCLGEDLDQRSDIFSLGIVFWEFITGTALFQATDRKAIVDAILDGNVPRPSSVNQNIPPALDDVIMKALAHRPKDRFQSSREMSVAISRCCDGDRVSEADLAKMMLEMFSGKRADLSREGEVGEEIVLEDLLFDDLEAKPPVRKDGEGGRRRSRIPRSTLVLLVVAILLLTGALVLRFAATGPTEQAPARKPPAQEAARGIINVDSSPRGARITIQGEDTGKVTPATVTGMHIGADLEVGLFKNGYSAWYGRIRLENEEARRISAELIQDPSAKPKKKPTRKPRRKRRKRKR